MPVLRNTSPYQPEYRGQLRQIDEQKPKREQLLQLALTTYGHLIPILATFRLDYLGMLIHQTYDQSEPRNQLMANICLVNGDAYCPFQRLADGSFRQL